MTSVVHLFFGFQSSWKLSPKPQSCNVLSGCAVTQDLTSNGWQHWPSGKGKRAILEIGRAVSKSFIS
jgi:hypothetical protein